MLYTRSYVYYSELLKQPPNTCYRNFNSTILELYELLAHFKIPPSHVYRVAGLAQLSIVKHVGR